jgi:hypothetical protein
MKLSRLRRLEHALTLARCTARIRLDSIRNLEAQRHTLQIAMMKQATEIAGLQRALAVVQRQLQKPVDDRAVQAAPYWQFSAEHLFNLHAQDLQAFERDCLARAQ